MTVELEGLPLPHVQYECPLCDYILDEPPINFAGLAPERPTVDLHDYIGAMVELAMVRQMREVEAAFREHFAMHTAQVILEAL